MKAASLACFPRPDHFPRLAPEATWNALQGTPMSADAAPMAADKTA